MEANKSKGCIRTLEPGEIDDGPLESWVPTSFFCSERGPRDYQREDSFRFSNQTWQNKPWWYHVAWTLTAARCFCCTIAFSEWSCSPGSRSDGNVLTSRHGEEYRRSYRFLWRGLVLSRPLKVYKAIRMMFGDRVSLYLTQHVVRKRAQDNRNDYPLVVAMIPDKCAWMT